MTFKTIKSVLQNLNFVLSELQGLCLGLILLKNKKKKKSEKRKERKSCAVVKCSV